jgi:hypothetical protein
MPLLVSIGFCLSLATQGVARGDDISAVDRDFFEAKVRPILVARCYECHSGASKTLRGGLRLDHRAGVLEGGDTGPAIEPQDLDNSLLLQAIRYDDPLMKMPPKGKLPDSEIAVLIDWVNRGTPDPRTEPPPVAARKPARVINLEAERRHWAYQPLKVVEPPPARDISWCITPIDQFILATLELKALTPSPAAEPRVLIRRAYFDLAGLPPTPEQVERFVQDDPTQAFERVIDELLESPRYGERWARHWLDLARWGESHGFEHDYDRPTAYPYRDFVIEALNRDLPYDTFVKWQLAGDEYEPGNNLALKATGFLGAGTHSTQITKNQVEKERYDELDDMLNTTGTAFLGLTFGCARCHDHKFDPIPTRDYYRLLATFTSTVRAEVDLVPDQAGYQKALEKYEREHQPYVDALSRFEAEELAERCESWERARAGLPVERPRWVLLEPSKVESKGNATSRRLADGSWLFEGPNAEFDTYTITAACDLAEITAIRIDALADASLPAGGPGRAGNGNFALTDLKLKVGPRYGIGTTATPRLVNAKATFEQAGLPVSAAVDSDTSTGWAVDPQFGRDHSAVFEIGSNLRTDAGSTLTFVLDFHNNAGHNFGRMRVWATDAPRPVGLDDDGIPGAVRSLLEIDSKARSDEQKQSVLAWYKTIDLKWRSLNQDLEDHAKTAPAKEGMKAMICSEGIPAVRLHTQGDDFLPETHLLRRGDPNQKEEAVTQGFLQALMPSSDSERLWQLAPPAEAHTSYRRRALAEWMTDTDRGAGHLLARVIVNRVWQQHFGHGLVATASDFGTQGAPPSHPELLDWLANRLIEGGWRLKPLHKLIMSSAVYRQSSVIDASRASIDPENGFLWRQNRRRLEAEAIRDALLFVSGLLDERMYGPGSLDERMRRRSVYFTIKRSRLIPMMALFDAPDALVPIAVRSSTTVAPQALYLLNSPTAREWAAGFASRVRPLADESPEVGIGRAYQLGFGRGPSNAELSDALAFLASYRQTDSGESDQAAWTDLCQVLMCSSEFLFVE